MENAYQNQSLLCTQLVLLTAHFLSVDTGSGIRSRGVTWDIHPVIVLQKCVLLGVLYTDWRLQTGANC